MPLEDEVVFACRGGGAGLAGAWAVPPALRDADRREGIGGLPGKWAAAPNWR